MINQDLKELTLDDDELINISYNKWKKEIYFLLNHIVKYNPIKFISYKLIFKWIKEIRNSRKGYDFSKLKIKNPKLKISTIMSSSFIKEKDNYVFKFWIDDYNPKISYEENVNFQNPFEIYCKIMTIEDMEGNVVYEFKWILN